MAETAQHTLRKNLLQAVSEAQGLPRWQIRHLLLNLVTPSSNACGGASCSRVFDLKTTDVESFLDETHKQITSQTSYWNDTSKKERLTILLNSFRRDYPLPIKGAPHDPVTFKNPAIATAIARELREGHKTITHADLTRIKSLELILHTTTLPKVSFDLEDLFKLPQLRELRITTDSLAAVEEIARFGDGLEKLVFTWTPLSREIPRVSTLEALSSLPRLYDLKLVYTSLEDAEQLSRLFPRIRNFTIDRPLTKVTENTLRFIAALPSLRKIGLHGIPYEDLGPVNMTFPRNVVSAEYVSSLKPRDAHKARIDSCSNLSHFRIFARATTMVIQGCRIGAMQGFGQPMAWQILSFRDCYSVSGQAIKINPSAEVRELMVFQAERSPSLDLDEVTKQEIMVRFAQTPHWH